MNIIKKELELEDMLDSTTDAEKKKKLEEKLTELDSEKNKLFKELKDREYTIKEIEQYGKDNDYDDRVIMSAVEELQTKIDKAEAERNRKKSQIHRVIIRNGVIK